ncbi:hypothetical protein A6B43_06200 [Vespertiliibacter pulmonis]|uniref:Copper-exporting P-type ATPase n=1 Tax=Vespertiliibacter pulmonis TaxID=1443036 RepID=A0A3N4VKW6_9PAST|nr:copper-translocating P-type ATPase [Vespertiliibacter pulmonis]QLB21140.1 hypothetical protein A6B43_06200 [Vespertiliibacter pulmonis]RPE83756.1 Cu+-exporting ATPase [Vespertiliibacter pulmonis]
MSQEYQFLLSGLHCAACVHRVEKMVGKLPNVELISVNLADQTAFVQGNIVPDEVIQTISKLGFGAELLESEQTRREKQQYQMQKALKYKKWAFISALVVGLSLMLYGFFWGMRLSETNQWQWLAWAGITLSTMWFSGRHFFQGAWTSLKNYSTNMDSLVALSTGVAWLYSFYLTISNQLGAELYYEASVMIIGFINLGKYLELKAKQRSSSALEKLLAIAPQQAVIFEGDVTKTIPVKAIKQHMRIQALTGDRLVVDGVLESGILWVDESMLTGEALPVQKQAGDQVKAGTFIQDGSGIYRAEQVGSQTALARIVNAVRHAQSSKPPLAKTVDKISSIFVPVVVSIALVSSLIWLALGKDLDFALSVFTSVVIISCPCALGLAIPLSTIAGVARSAEFGVLVRNIDALQASSEIDTLVFDKTGTLTTGIMQVTDVKTFGEFEQNVMLRLVKGLELQASHPISQAIVNYCADLTACEFSHIQVMRGLGIAGEWQGKEVRVGNAQFADLGGVQIDLADDMGTRVFVSVDDQTVGMITLQDQLREETLPLIKQFQQQGYKCVMLTGDRQETADYYARQLGLDSVIANVLPEEKAIQIVKLQDSGHKVAMVGDGINDSPALAQAEVGVAMFNGSDIAVETADLSLMHKGLMPLAAILQFSKQVQRNMKQSLMGAFIYNVVSIPIAAGILYPYTGWLLNPMVSAAAMALSSITVVLNSQRLLR